MIPKASDIQSPSTPPGQARVLVIEDHPMVRQGLCRLIDEQPDLMVCGEAEDAEKALAAAEELRPDLVLVDLSLRGRSGLDLIKELHARWPQLPMLVLSMHEESLHAERALRAGARGYVMKQEATESVMTAIRKVLAGGIYVSDAMASRLLQKLVSGRVADVGSSPLERLTDREFQVFTLIGQGIGPSEIAARLKLSVKTIETHREHIKQKLGLKSGAELLRYCVQHAMEKT